MSREPFEAMPDVMNAKQLAAALHISKSGAYNLLNSPDFPTLRICGRKLVMKQDLLLWLKRHTSGQEGAGYVTQYGWKKPVFSALQARKQAG